MNTVFIVYILHADGSIDLDRAFTTDAKAQNYIDSSAKSKSYDMYWEEVEVE